MEDSGVLISKRKKWKKKILLVGKGNVKIEHLSAAVSLITLEA